MNPDPKSTRTMNQKAKGIEEENVWQTVEMRWKITECWNEMVSNGDLNKFKGKYIYIYVYFAIHFTNDYSTYKQRYERIIYTNTYITTFYCYNSVGIR